MALIVEEFEGHTYAVNIAPSKYGERYDIVVGIDVDEFGDRNHEATMNAIANWDEAVKAAKEVAGNEYGRVAYLLNKCLVEAKHGRDWRKLLGE